MQGQGCTVTNFWKCEDPPHDCVFPGDSGSGNNPPPPEEQEDSEDTPPSKATVPDSPGNFEASPRLIAILLRWEDPASDGGSPIYGLSVFVSSEANSYQLECLVRLDICWDWQLYVDNRIDSKQAVCGSDACCE